MLATLWLLQILLIVWDGQIGDIHLMSNNSNSMQKDLNSIILYLLGIVIITLHSLNRTNLHTDFSSILISYAILICVLSQFYECIRYKKRDKDISKWMTYAKHTELIFGIIFIISFVYNTFL